MICWPAISMSCTLEPLLLLTNSRCFSWYSRSILTPAKSVHHYCSVFAPLLLLLCSTYVPSSLHYCSVFAPLVLLCSTNVPSLLHCCSVFAPLFLRLFPNIAPYLIHYCSVFFSNITSSLPDYCSVFAPLFLRLFSNIAPHLIQNCSVFFYNIDQSLLHYCFVFAPQLLRLFSTITLLHLCSASKISFFCKLKLMWETARDTTRYLQRLYYIKCLHYYPKYLQ